MTKSRLAETFSDARKALRLIFQYHRRIMAMAKVIATEAAGMTYASATSEGDATALRAWRPDGDELDYWEAAPFQSVTFMWSTQATDQPLGKQDKILYASFSAEYLYWDEDLDPDIEQWPAPEDSRSVLMLILAKPTKDLGKMTPEKLWYAHDLEADGIMHVAHEKALRFVRQQIDLASLPDKASVSAAAGTFIRDAARLLDEG